MKRRQFITTTVLSSLGLLLAQSPLQAQNRHKSNPYLELIGKGQPTLMGGTYKMRSQVLTSFQQMREAAKSSGIDLRIVSSYRSFEHQNRIWERKYKKYMSNGLDALSAIKKIIEYSTIPGTSRHHWGTDLDLIDGSVAQPTSLLVPSHFNETGCFHNMKEWMDQHSESYGFYLVYTENSDRKGFKYEPWHYSFKPLSQDYLKSYRSLELKFILEQEHLLGNEHFTQDFLSQYFNENILSINSELL